jgi:hypothetical protein
MPHLIVRPEDTTETLYKITFRGKNFKLSAYESDEGIRFFLGGHSNIYCLEGFIYKNEEKIRENNDVSIGTLVQVYYDQACSLEGNFTKGIDTKKLIHIFLSIIKNNYPHVSRIQLIDASTKACDNGSEVSLSNMLYVRKGQTWYESHFSAFMDPSYTKRFDDAVVRFNKSKINMSWKVFKGYIQGSLMLSETSMKNQYEQSKTWQEFFNWIATKLGDSKFCEFVSPWLNNFMFLKMGFNFSMASYYIPLITYKPVLYTTHKFNEANKRRFTIKRSRLEKMASKIIA